MIVSLRTSYRGRGGQPVVDRVDTDIFRLVYFAACMDCTFCHDMCCSHGADVDADTQARWATLADDLEQYLGLPRERWLADERQTDPEVVGGYFTRTQVANGACIFLNRAGRGCRIHTYCLERGLDFRSIKPMICSLFPLTWDAGLLLPANETRDRSLICLGEGPTLYRAARADVVHFFGEELAAELDGLERRT